MKLKVSVDVWRPNGAPLIKSLSGCSAAIRLSVSSVTSAVNRPEIRNPERETNFTTEDTERTEVGPVFDWISGTIAAKNVEITKSDHQTRKLRLGHKEH